MDLSPVASDSKLEKLVFRENALTRLDLTPLRGCPELRELDVSQNRLTEIDLAPLIACTKLKRLDLSSNELSEIDLGPLSALARLIELGITSTSMRAVDLRPLSGLRGLHTLNFSVGDQEYIDLEPLRNSSLTRLSMSVNHPENIELFPLMHRQLHTFVLRKHHFHTARPADIDMTPLLFNRIENLHLGSLLISTVAYTHSTALSFFINSDIYNLQPMDYFINKWGWARMRNILAEHESIVARDDANNLHRVGLQEEVLKSIRLGWLAGLDADVIGVILDTPDGLSFEQLQERVLASGDEFLSEQLERDGPTHFFDVEEMSKYPEYSRLAPMLLERRKREMGEVTIFEDSAGSYDLESLWLTSYGFSALSNIDLQPPRTDLSSKDTKAVQGALSDFNLRVVRERSETHPVKMFHEMKAYLIHKTTGIVRERQRKRGIQSIYGLHRGFSFLPSG